MKLFTLRLVLFAVLLVLAAAWTKEDYEIFRLNDEISATEGHNVTFYGAFYSPCAYLTLLTPSRLLRRPPQRQPGRHQQSLPQEISPSTPRQGQACLHRQYLQRQVQVSGFQGRRQCQQRPLEARDQQRRQGGRRTRRSSEHCRQYSPWSLPRTLRPFPQERISQVEGYWLLLLALPSWLGIRAVRSVLGVWRCRALRCPGA